MSDKSTEHIGVLADTLLSSTMKYYTSTTEFNCRSDLHAHQMYVCVMDKQGKKLVPHERHTSSSGSCPAKQQSEVCSAGTGWSMSVTPLIGFSGIILNAAGDQADRARRRPRREISLVIGCGFLRQ